MDKGEKICVSVLSACAFGNLEPGGCYSWMGTAQVCLPYTFYVVFFFFFALHELFPWLTKPYSDLSHPFLKFIRIYKLAQVISSSPPWRNLKITLHTSVISQIAQNF